MSLNFNIPTQTEFYALHVYKQIYMGTKLRNDTEVPTFIFFNNRLLYSYIDTDTEQIIIFYSSIY